MSVNISTIIPVYNGEKTISKCLDSILSQTIPPMEIIVVDDGSEDRTGDILRDYCARYESVKVVPSAHKGVSAARNAGIEAARCDYISFVDSDDYIAPDMYEKMSEGIVLNNADLCVCGYYTIKDGLTTPYELLLSGPVTSTELINDMFTGVSEGFLPTRVFSKRLFSENKLPTDITHCEDLFFQVDLLSKQPSINIFCVKEPLYYYINNSQSATSVSKLFKGYSFVYNTAFQRIFMLLSDKPTLLSAAVQKYKSILEYSMYSLLTSASADNKSISSMQCEMKQWRKFIAKHSHSGAKSMLKYDFMSRFPNLYKSLRLS